MSLKTYPESLRLVEKAPCCVADPSNIFGPSTISLLWFSKSVYELLATKEPANLLCAHMNCLLLRLTDKACERYCRRWWPLSTRREPNLLKAYFENIDPPFYVLPAFGPLSDKHLVKILKILISRVDNSA
ncbi:hypothetical protein CEXT_271361 [Caerostris extrusa]|uniref:Uncharacterized protein n=1 Tax=Caerostris extrusa TaxID=172846 RepID=A0AAV4U211_CAEEX|nr:hypothetical protein CEXT_271361 [Caerostris extrusa]